MSDTAEYASPGIQLLLTDTCNNLPVTLVESMPARLLVLGDGTPEYFYGTWDGTSPPFLVLVPNKEFPKRGYGRVTQHAACKVVYEQIT